MSFQIIILVLVIFIVLFFAVLTYLENRKYRKTKVVLNKKHPKRREEKRNDNVTKTKIPAVYKNYFMKKYNIVISRETGKIIDAVVQLQTNPSSAFENIAYLVDACRNITNDKDIVLGALKIMADAKILHPDLSLWNDSMIHKQVYQKKVFQHYVLDLKNESFAKDISDEKLITKVFGWKIIYP